LNDGSTITFNIAPPTTNIDIVGDAGSVGSERGQELLQLCRDENQMIDKIWQAHESGLAVTKNASEWSQFLLIHSV
jgi:hypothetical protein